MEIWLKLRAKVKHAGGSVSEPFSAQPLSADGLAEIWQECREIMEAHGQIQLKAVYGRHELEIARLIEQALSEGHALASLVNEIEIAMQEHIAESDTDRQGKLW